NFRSFGGYTRTDLENLENVPLTTSSLFGGWERRTASVIVPGSDGATYLLRGSGSQADHFDVLADRLITDGADADRRNFDGKYLAPGGFLGSVAEKAWSTL